MIKIINITENTDELTVSARDIISSADIVFVQSDSISCYEKLKKLNADIRSLDFLYEDAADFNELVEKAAAYLKESSCYKDCAFLCLGGIQENRIVSELAVNGEAEIIPSLSNADICIAFSKVYFSTDAVLRVAFHSLDSICVTGYESILVTNISGRYELSDVRLFLSSLCDSAKVAVTTDGKSRICDLSELDRIEDTGRETCVFMPCIPYTERERYTVHDLEKIMDRLRGRNGCPWDIEQTHESIRKNVLEEAAEVAEAIDEKDPDHLYDELGDLLLQVVFHAKIAQSSDEFDMSDITTAICSKLIRRHPHIFGDMKAETPEDVLKIWQDVKNTEKR